MFSGVIPSLASKLPNSLHLKKKLCIKKNQDSATECSFITALSLQNGCYYSSFNNSSIKLLLYPKTRFIIKILSFKFCKLALKKQQHKKQIESKTQ